MSDEIMTSEPIIDDVGQEGVDDIIDDDDIHDVAGDGVDDDIDWVTEVGVDDDMVLTEALMSCLDEN